MKKQKIALLLGAAFILSSCGGNEAHVHTLTLVDGSDATCTTTGFKPYYKCEDCNELFEDKEGTKKITSPIEIPALGHKLTKTEGKVPTCTEAGTKTYYTCSACELKFEDEAGTKEIKDINLPALGHKLTKHEGVESTCTEKGYETYWDCETCETLFSDAEGKNPIESIIYKDLKAHNLEHVDKQDGDCFHDVIDEHYKCLDCNKYFKDSEGKTETTLQDLTHESPIKHSLTFHQGYPATDTLDGLKDYYECEHCHHKYSDKEATTEIEDIVIKSKGWAYFAPGFELISINNSPLENIQSEAITNDEGQVLNQITIKEGTTKDSSYNLKPGEGDPTNTRTCLNAGLDTEFRLTVTNNGTENISFRYFLDDYGDKGGVNITDLKPEETRTVEFSVNWASSTPGCYHGITLLNDLTSEAKISINGYFSTLGKVDGKEIKLVPHKEANIKSFNAGETFSSEGLVAKLEGGPNWDSAYTRIFNYTTNFDGHVFTNEDAGTREVKVMFGGTYYTYEINVVKAHVHTYIKHEAKEPTDNLNGNKEYYECEECHKLYKDTTGKEELSYSDVLIATEGFAHFAPGLNVSVANGDSNPNIISSAEVLKENGLYANRITIHSNAKTEDSFWLKPNEQAKFNDRTVLFNGLDTTFKLTVTNDGEEEVSFRYYLDDYGDKAGAEVDNLKPGETREVVFGTPNWKTDTIGCYHGITLKSDLTKEANLIIDGYYSLHKKVDGSIIGITPVSSATKTTYQVGDAFSNDGLRAKLTKVNGGNSFIDNLATNFDGHTFTEDDLGTKTVKVMFGGASYEYEINVYPKHEHKIVKRELVEATDNKNGIKEHYECEVCHLLYKDALGTESILKEDTVIQAEGFATFIPALNVCKVGGPVTDTDEIDSKLVSRENGAHANNITIKNGVKSGAQFWMQPNASDPVNTRTILYEGNDTKFFITVTNNGEEEISFRYFFDNYGDKGGVDVDNLKPGETREVEFIVKFDTTTFGCYHGLTLKNDLTKDASLTINGKYSLLGKVNGKDLSIIKAKDAKKLTFKVGETFTSEGLVAALKGRPNGEFPDASRVENYYTNFDGHTFTTEDLGKKEVIVTFAGSSFVYEIEVTE